MGKYNMLPNKRNKKIFVLFHITSSKYFNNKEYEIVTPTFLGEDFKYFYSTRDYFRTKRGKNYSHSETREYIEFILNKTIIVLKYTNIQLHPREFEIVELNFYA